MNRPYPHRGVPSRSREHGLSDLQWERHDGARTGQSGHRFEVSHLQPPQAIRLPAGFRLDPERAWESYLADLRYVLDDVEQLLDNIDADRVVISANNGEAFGEYGVYGRPIGALHSYVRNVLWAITTASGSGTYTPEIPRPSASDETSNRDVDETLDTLGYNL